MAQASKDTVYIDIDDEITSIIDKLNNSDKKIVALVLPKRAAVLQSIVNMKLLKRSAEDANKSIVLITSESGLLPLAGAVGVHVAKTLQSKPAIPAAPKTSDEPLDVNENDIEETELDTNKTVGELSDEPIEVDNDDPIDDEAASASKKSGKKFKIPNFDKFRVRIVLGVFAIILLIIGFIFATKVLPKARVLVKTNVTSVRSELKLTGDPAATELDEEKKVVPSSRREVEKTEAEKVAATGEKNVGEKATGEVTLYIACSPATPPTIPAGTGVSTNNLTFVTQSAVSLTTPDFSDGCRFKGTANVTAQNAGDQYNLSSGRSFSVAGYSAVSGTNNDAMSGGTSKIVKVITQKDVDAAKQKIAERSDEVRNELVADLEEDGYFVLQDSFQAGKEKVVTSPKVDAEGNEVTVTSTTTYSMTGLKRDDLSALIAKNVSGQIDTSKQEILDDGLGSAIVKVDDLKANGAVTVTITTSVIAGAQQDGEAIKQAIAGKKKNESLNAIKSRPGVSDAEITYSPFWVSSTPGNTSKITVVFEQNTNDAGSN